MVCFERFDHGTSIGRTHQLFFLGAGKSTLIKMLIGKEQPDEGEIKIGDTVNIVSVGQERMDELNGEKTVFE